jgi:eukaryotic-like serine/threonine-protein kinase
MATCRCQSVYRDLDYSRAADHPGVIACRLESNPGCGFVRLQVSVVSPGDYNCAQRMGLTSGTKLGPYEILSPLGAGGMGEVYLARDTRLGRDVAVKVLPAHLSSNPDLRQRMEREAKAISSLNHPHICTLHDVGSQDGVEFLVMERLEGETLADRLHRGALPLDEALIIGIQIADALDKAHARGIVHRDLKPANIMLTKNGPKLMDFGLAKPAPVLSSASGAGSLTPSTPTMSVTALSGSASPLTQKGTVVGTFQYMAPEVLQGAEADARSDIFSFGCVIYEAVTGRRAFEGKSQFSVLGAILDKEPERISAVRPSSPPRVDETVCRCLAKNPEQRYGCMHDVKIQLQALAEAGPQAAGAQAERMEHAPARLRLAWLVAGIATLIAFSVGIAYIFQAPKPPPVVRSSILPPAGTAFVTMLPSSGPAVLSPDGTRLAFTARDEKGRVLLYVRPLTSLTAQPLPGTEDASYPFWSPDSREVGFFVPGKLRKTSASGGPPQNVCDAVNGRGGAWGQDMIVFTPSASQPLLRVPVAGGTPEPASKLDTSRVENSHRWPWFLPDGKHFLFWARSSRGTQESMLYVGEPGSLQAKALMKSESTAVYASGHLLFMRDQSLMAQPFDPRRIELSGEPVPIAEHVAVNGATARPLFTASQTGTLVYQSGETSGGWNLLWFDRSGKQTGSIAQVDRYLNPALSPDGNRLAVMIFAGAQGIGDIWVFDLTRGTSTRLTFGGDSHSNPVWTPDGKTVFYASTAKGPPHIYAKAADGSGPERSVLETPDTVELSRSFSPDGRFLVYERRLAKSETGYHLWALPLFGDGKPFPIVQDASDESLPAVSPDGKWMAYRSNESGRQEIYITAFPAGGAKWQVSTNGGTAAKWRRDGKELFFLDPTDKIVAVDVNASGNAVRLGTPRDLFQTIGIQREYGPFDVTADGKKFLLNSGNLKEGSDPFTLVLNWPAELKK